MKTSAVKSAYLGWLAAAIAGERGASSLTAAAEQTLVTGYATGYDIADVAIFVRSLRAHYEGACALVVDSDPALRAFLAGYGVEALDAPVLCKTSDDWQPHPVVTRFAGLGQLLEERPWVRHALLTDVRDVVFQGNPFGSQPASLDVFSEGDTPLRGHDFNMKYLRAIAGDSLAQALGEKACICVGTVMGERESLIRFCRLILLLGAIPRSAIGGAFGADQATANLAVHLGLIEAEIHPNFRRVATLGLTPPGRCHFDGAFIRNPDGSASPIVHQHDRHPDLLRAMQGLWGEGVEARIRARPIRTLAARRRKLSGAIRKRLPELR
ncbi:hypothetical protein [Brevundimonas vesicularis]|uniref:hypothetical protein n=1 Tax=Brevundimonas vesicularis TaxID=41276 RepID=UPI0038D395A4